MQLDVIEIGTVGIGGGIDWQESDLVLSSLAQYGLVELGAEAKSRDRISKLAAGLERMGDVRSARALRRKILGRRR